MSDLKSPWREGQFSMSVGLTEDGYVLCTDIMGRVTKEVVELRSRLKDKATRDWLIAQGWTPPNE